MNLREQFERCTRFGINILDLVMFHDLKFPVVDPEKQEQKVYEEYAEFQCAIEKQDKIDEAVDCIIALIGFLVKNDVDVEKKQSETSSVVCSKNHIQIIFTMWEINNAYKN